MFCGVEDVVLEFYKAYTGRMWVTLQASTFASTRNPDQHLSPPKPESASNTGA